MNKLRIAGMVCALFLGALLLWYFRPWSDYSPAKLAELTDPDRLDHTFQHMIDYLPYRVIHAAEAPFMLPEALKPLSFHYDWNGQQKSLEDFWKESSTLGVLVLHQGAVVYERYDHDASPASVFTSWSVAKSVVATVLMMAVQDGTIASLDDPVSRYASQFSGSAYGEMTLQQLLTMSADIEFDEDYSAENSDVRRFFFDAVILGKNPDLLARALPRASGASGPEGFHYVSPNSHVLSAVVRAIYKKNLAEIIEEKIWQPLGMEADAYWLQHKPGDAGVALGYCCLNARLRDYARFGQYYLDAWHGRGGGAQALPEDWLHSLNQPASDAHRPGTDRYQGRGYSSHFWIPPEPRGEFMAAGIYGQFVFIDPEREVVIVKMSADPEWLTRHQENAHVMQLIADTVIR